MLVHGWFTVHEPMCPFVLTIQGLEYLTYEITLVTPVL